MRARFWIAFFVCVEISFAQIWTLQTTLTASNFAANDQFGYSVSMTDNYALVGAINADPDGVNDAGSAYIFVRSGAAWTEQAILAASNKGAYDNFGWSASVTDNYALVGANGVNSAGMTDVGAAYIFVRSDTTWTQQAMLTATIKADYDEFGGSVSLTDNYALIGAHRADPGVTNAGAAYVFVRSGTAWTQQAMLTATIKATGDLYGSAVALTDDYALVGAYYADPGGFSNSGAAYIYSRSTETWGSEIVLTASNKAANDGFGRSVSMKNNYALIGLDSASRSYIFSRSSTSWGEQAIITSAAGGRNRVGISDSYALINNRVVARSGNVWNLQASVIGPVAYSAAITNTYAMTGIADASAGGFSWAGTSNIYISSGT